MTSNTSFIPTASNLVILPEDFEAVQSALRDERRNIKYRKNITQLRKSATNIMSNKELSESILRVMKETKEPMLTVKIAEAVGLQTRGQVNPTIYALEKAGKLVKVQVQPPIWKLAESVLAEDSNKSKVLYLTEGGFISLADVIPLLENETLSDIVYFTTNADEVNENNGVSYQVFGKNDAASDGEGTLRSTSEDYSTLFFCNIMLLTAETSLDVYVCYDESFDTLKRLFTLPLISKSNIKTINSLHELV